MCTVYIVTYITTVARPSCSSYDTYDVELERVRSELLVELTGEDIFVLLPKFDCDDLLCDALLRLGSKIARPISLDG